MEFIAVFLLILLNGLFAMTEMALVSSKKARLQQLVDKGSIGAIKAMALQDNPGHFLSAIQVGITTISIVSGIVGEKSLVEPTINFLINIGINEHLAHTSASVLVIVCLTFLSVIFGEIIPKRLGLVLPEKIAAIFAIPMNFITKIAFPIVWFLTYVSESLMNFFGMNKIEQTPVSNEEIKELMEVGSSAGVFHEAEQEIVANVLNMDEKKAVSIMTHRTDLFYVDLEDGFESNIEKIIYGEHSKILVVEGSVNHVVGIINVVDILSLIHKNEEFNMKDKMKKPLYLPESVTTTQVLEQFKLNKSEMAIIVNEYGENIGLITLVDIMESIVGDVGANDNEEDPEIIERADGSFLVDGLITLDKLGSYFKIEEIKTNESVHTLAGLIFEHSGFIPKAGYKAEMQFKNCDLFIEIMDMDNNCIDKVLIKKVDKTEESAVH